MGKYHILILIILVFVETGAGCFGEFYRLITNLTGEEHVLALSVSIFIGNVFRFCLRVNPTVNFLNPKTATQFFLVRLSDACILDCNLGHFKNRLNNLRLMA